MPKLCNSDRCFGNTGISKGDTARDNRCDRVDQKKTISVVWFVYRVA